MKIYLRRDCAETKVSRLIGRIEQQLKDEMYCFKVAGMATMHKQQVSPIPASMFHGLSDVQNIQNPR